MFSIFLQVGELHLNLVHGLASTYKAMNRRRCSFLLYVLILFMLELLSGQVSYATQTDIQCLKSIQKSLAQLTNIWNFSSNGSEGFICNFVGVECWHPQENRVLNIKLQHMGLNGQFPLGIVNCNSLTGLNLSGNKLDGPIPSNVSKLVPFLTSLDLSQNNFSGPIPIDLSNCAYLNVLLLDHNHLSGHIPPQLQRLARLKQFSVANNNLTGQIPRLRANISADNYAHNSGLCGSPLRACNLGISHKLN